MKLLLSEFAAHPAPIQNCHASTVLPLPDGVCAAWFAGGDESTPSTHIFVARRDADGWHTPLELSVRDDYAHWNPVLFSPAPGRIRLHVKAGYAICDWNTWCCESEDGGRSFSPLAPLQPDDTCAGSDSGWGPVKDKPILLSDGTLLAGCSTERPLWKPFADRSRDGGRSWQHVPIPKPTDVGAIQPTFWESAPGQVHALLRTDAGWIYRSDSADYGQTWCEAYPTALPGNNSGIDCARLSNGWIALALNPVHWQTAGACRTPLCIYLSRDNGDTWENALTLEDTPYEYSYPALVWDGSLLHLTYTWRHQQIAYCRIDPEIG